MQVGRIVFQAFLYGMFLLGAYTVLDERIRYPKLYIWTQRIVFMLLLWKCILK